MIVGAVPLRSTIPPALNVAFRGVLTAERRGFRFVDPFMTGLDHFTEALYKKNMQGNNAFLGRIHVAHAGLLCVGGGVP